MGVEPTIAAERRRPTVLKTEPVTGPDALPFFGTKCLRLHVSWAGRSLHRSGEVFHVEHFVLANLYVQIYTFSCK